MRHKPVVEQPELTSCQVCTSTLMGQSLCDECKTYLGVIASRLAMRTNMTYEQALRALTVTLADMPKRMA